MSAEHVGESYIEMPAFHKHPGKYCSEEELKSNCYSLAEPLMGNQKIEVKNES